MSGLDRWLDEVATAALVGTARREPPPVPATLGLVAEEEGHPPEDRLLASAAVADALLRGGAPLPPSAETTQVSPPETRAQCGDAAAQLLHLLLTQPPVSKATRDELVAEWLRLADAADQRVPWPQLPPLLDLAAARPPVARALGGALGERGAWLVGLNPAWAGASGDEAAQPSGDADEVSARDLLETQWDTLTAKARAEAVRSLRQGLSLADEPLLERALDDKAKTVREVAATVLDLLPGSARGARMAGRLRTLLRVRGTISRHLEVDVPDPPDEAGIRDGLTAPGRGGGPPATVWLAQLVRAAPLSTWTDVTGRSVPATLKMVRDKDVLAWLVEVVLDRRDTEWALACVEHGVPDPRLHWLLPQEKRTELLVSWVARPPAGRDLHGLLVQAPRPWPDELGRAVLQRLRGQGASTGLARAAAPLLPAALSPSLSREVTALLEQVPADATHLRRALTETLQLHAFRTSLTEAFR
ncbi:MAG TPA: DUF5691 domain-containing protein [Nocardioides sp.]|nr:DUF5691 domain-containing protein [Nocardioides sp.]